MGDPLDERGALMVNQFTQILDDDERTALERKPLNFGTLVPDR